jgi:CheY-like chemotaxis protein
MTADKAEGPAGLRVLIVEDEPLVTMLLEGMMEDLGNKVLGPFLRLEPALEYIKANHQTIDVAILDVNLGGIRSFAAADLLLQLGVPFVFASGYDEAGIDERWRMWPNIGKLFYEEELKATLNNAVAQDRRSFARARSPDADSHRDLATKVFVPKQA